MSRIEAVKIVKKYADKLKSQNYSFAHIYLFGSYSRNTANQYSDLDVAVIVKTSIDNQDEQENRLWQLTREVDTRIEPVSFTVEDFKDEKNPLIYEIKTTGIKIV